ncbi:conserved membrane hypothetical protein [uncultured Paludibacter sp.]|uniref:Bacterial membrane protein YfhO n=1 Tax=uncultured Paludibacter sp. TaxID=497635 RepID=A0A653AB24_9BACT|nr:conserved membrane hypothetical protein [uncultured Paludibacter sp.]
MNKTILRSFIPHIAAILLFIVIAFVYFPSIIEGKQLVAHDTQGWKCMAQETVKYNESHDDVTLWTNSMFGGMPTYQISMTQPNNVLQYVERVFLTFPRPVSNLILYLIGFYILLLAFGVNPWLSIVGSIGFTFASYNFVIIAAGHNSKAMTIAYMAPLIGAVFLTFRRKKILGGLLTAFFLSLAIRANHIQILYYTFIILLIFGIVELIYSIKEKQINELLKTLGVLFIAAIVAIGMNATSLLTTYEYGKYTMRGSSNGLTSDTQNSQHGLNKDYITQWSYGKAETMTLLIPNFYGGASGGALSENSETAKHLQSLGVPESQTKEIISQMPLYWGSQPGTSGPVYLGAIIIFLFVMSFFLVDKRIKWWLLPVIALTLMLSWGRNFMWLTNIFVDYVPMYNKFRTVSMMLVATGFGITLLAVLALKEIFQGNIEKKRLLNALKISTIITGGICLILALIPSLAGSFVSANDAQFTGDYSFLKETLPLDRKALLRSDAWRSLAFIVLSAGVIWLYINDKLKKYVAISLLGFLIFIDLFFVAKRYLNDNNFERKSKVENLIKPTPADEMIMQDKSQYRVLDLTTDIFNDATPSYFHKNIGGYHAAKLRRYQELINMQMEKELRQLFGVFSRPATQETVNATLDSLGVLNMLNLKYIIISKENAPVINTHANGNAWFVNKIRIANDANDEMKLLGEINTKKELVVDKSLASVFPQTLVPDSSATIVLTSYAPNHLTYHFNSKTDQVAVFSEIYYDKGWKATINGKEATYTRVNYLLRGMALKAGNYDIDFRFDPQSYKIGNILALICSILLIGMFIGYIVLKKQKITSDKH